MSFFGWSLSDVVLITGLTTKVVAALKEDGGSKTEYQTAIRSCEDLQKLLTELVNLDVHALDQDLLEQLKTHAEWPRDLLSNYVTKLRKYERSLGSNATKGCQHGVWKKAKWALSTAKDLEHFRATVASLLDTVKLTLAKVTV